MQGKGVLRLLRRPKCQVPQSSPGLATFALGVGGPFGEKRRDPVRHWGPVAEDSELHQDTGETLGALAHSLAACALAGWRRLGGLAAAACPGRAWESGEGGDVRRECGSGKLPRAWVLEATGKQLERACVPRVDALFHLLQIQGLSHKKLNQTPENSASEPLSCL